MKVHFIKTPEYDSENLNEVCKILTQYKKPIEFDSTIAKIDGLEIGFNDNNILTWVEIFEYCNDYRKKTKCSPNDFVVLLTTLKNKKNWFSHFDDKRNIFVQTSGWSKYTLAQESYPISHQVIENIIQSLMDIGEITLSNPYIHFTSIGCINDMCGDKEEIIFKLRTADICPSCLQKLKSKVKDNMVKQIFKLLDQIRTQLLFRTQINGTSNPLKIVLSEDNQLQLPDLNNKIITLSPLPKALYFLYLNNLNGIRLTELKKFKTDLINYYLRFNKFKDDDNRIESSVDILVDKKSNSFNVKRSRINEAITGILSEPLAKYYRIEGERGHRYKINLPIHLIDID